MRKGLHNTAPTDLRLVQTFAAIEHTGSFQQAARDLGVSTSAVSQALLLLETQLEHELIDRSTRPVTLTNFGQRFLPIVKEMIQATRQFQWSCDELLRNRQREIRIGCVDSFAATVGPDLVKSLMSSAGSVVMHSGITPQVVDQLTRHEIDVAICTDASQTHASLYSIPVCQETWVIASAPHAQWPAELTWKSLTELSKHLALIRYSQRSIIGAQIDRFLAHLGLNPPRRFEFDATDSLLSLVNGGVGWAVTSPLCLLQSLHHAKQLNISTVPVSPLGHRTFYLLCRIGPDQRLADQLAQTTRNILATRTVATLTEQLPALGAACLRALV